MSSTATLRLPTRRSKTAKASKPGKTGKPATPPRAEAPATASARRAGGPQDRALYSCGCGYAFKATVSTSVGCPNCGTAQAW